MESTIKQRKGQQEGFTELIDNLTSTDTTKALSANQGKILKGFIDAINNLLTSDDTTLDELQEIVNYIKVNKNDLENLGISNIAGLSDALSDKLDKGSYTGDAADLKSLIDSKMLKINTAEINSDMVLNVSSAISQMIYFCNSSDVAFNFPTGLPDGFRLTVVNNSDSNTVSFSEDSGVTFIKPEGVFCPNNFGVLQITKKNGSDTFFVKVIGGKPASKPEKYITNATQYTAVLEDKEKYLVFQNAIDFIIPANVFTKNDVIEGESEGGDVTVVEGSGATINQAAPLTKVIPQFGVLGLRFRTATNATLYGSLKPL
jgi:hypothetical protein